MVNRNFPSAIPQQKDNIQSEKKKNLLILVVFGGPFWNKPGQPYLIAVHWISRELEPIEEDFFFFPDSQTPIYKRKAEKKGGRGRWKTEA